MCRGSENCGKKKSSMIFLQSTLFNHKQSNSDIAEYIIGGITCVIILVSLIGNVLLLFTVAKTKVLQRMSTTWYISLAVTDLTRAVICMPVFVVLLFSPDWSLSEEMCPVYYCLQISIIIVSVLTLTAISIDRVFMITRPLTYQRIVSFKKIIFLNFLLWLISFFVWLCAVAMV